MNTDERKRLATLNTPENRELMRKAIIALQAAWDAMGEFEKALGVELALASLDVYAADGPGQVDPGTFQSYLEAEVAGADPLEPE